jgi:hypothetical protein
VHVPIVGAMTLVGLSPPPERATGLGELPYFSNNKIGATGRIVVRESAKGGTPARIVG